MLRPGAYVTTVAVSQCDPQLGELNLNTPPRPAFIRQRPLRLQSDAIVYGRRVWVPQMIYGRVRRRLTDRPMGSPSNVQSGVQTGAALCQTFKESNAL